MSESNKTSFVTLVRCPVLASRSPVGFLWQNACVSLNGISSGVRTRLIGSGQPVQLHLIDSRAFIARIAPTTGDAEFSVGAITLLWACSHLNMVYYAHLQDLDALGKKVDIYPEEHPDLMAAMLLVQWAVKYAYSKESPGEWPTELPSPEEGLDSGSAVFPSTSLAIGALAFLVLHEIAHRVLGHQGGATGDKSKEQEFEADREAVEWFLEGASERAKSTLPARQTHIIAAMFVLCLKPMFTGHWNSNTHPAAWERMDRILGQMDLEPDGAVQMFAAQIKNLYFSITGRGTGGSFEGPAESMQQFFDTAAEESREAPSAREF